MKSIQGFTLGLVLGLGLALSSAGFAQNTTQTDPKKDAESCCSMSSCCKGDSCSMKDHSKNYSSKHGCCCCNGDSCNMKDKDKEKS